MQIQLIDFQVCQRSHCQIFHICLHNQLSLITFSYKSKCVYTLNRVRLTSEIILCID